MVQRVKGLSSWLGRVNLAVWGCFGGSHALFLILYYYLIDIFSKKAKRERFCITFFWICTLQNGSHTAHRVAVTHIYDKSTIRATHLEYTAHTQLKRTWSVGLARETHGYNRYPHTGYCTGTWFWKSTYPWIQTPKESVPMDTDPPKYPHTCKVCEYFGLWGGLFGPG